MDSNDLLLRLAVNDERVIADLLDGAITRSPGCDPTLDPRTLVLVRLAALVAVGGAVSSYGAQTDAAVGAGATVAELVEVLVGVLPIVGAPRVVAAASMLALTLGHDVDDAFDLLPDG